MFGYIYKTTNLINGKIYIGQKQSQRFVENYKGSGKLIKAALLKYGNENFICEILEWCENKQQLNEREKFYIALYNSRDFDIGYNISKGGDGGDVFHSLPQTQQKEVRQKLKNSLKNRAYVTKDGLTYCIKLDELQTYLDKGFKQGFSEDIKRKLSEAHKNNPQPLNSGNWKPGQVAWNKGIPCPEDKKQKIRETLTGTKQSKETCEKRSRSMKEKYRNGYKSPMSGKQPWNKGINFVWVANKTEIHYISPDKLQEYLDKGYHRGRKKY